MIYFYPLSLILFRFLKVFQILLHSKCVVMRSLSCSKSVVNRYIFSCSSTPVKHFSIINLIPISIAIKYKEKTFSCFNLLNSLREFNMINYISTGGCLGEDHGFRDKECSDLEILRELRFEEFEELPDVADFQLKPRITLKIMNYNVLSQQLLEQHGYLYRNCSPVTLKWKFRYPRILRQIIEQNPDILCLQEVQESHINEFYYKLEDLGYESIFIKRTGYDKGDGCAIYFRRNMFILEKESKVEYYRHAVPRLDRDNVGLIVKLRLKAAREKVVIVANTHLLYNPRRVDVRLAQMRLLLSEIYQMAEGKPVVFLTGDLNSQPDSLVVKLITEGAVLDTFNPLPPGLAELPPCPMLSSQKSKEPQECSDQSSSIRSEGKSDYHHLNSHVCHNFNFQSAYPYFVGNDTEATTYQNRWITVDYIFYSNIDGLTLQSRLRLPTSEECSKGIKRLPNYANPSDHLPLVASFVLDVD